MKERLRRFSRTPKRSVGRSATRPKIFSSFWNAAAWFLIVLTTSFVLGSIATTKKQLENNLADQMKNFEWMVLVQGSELEIDEVGRYLKQLPLVDDVRFVSSQDAFSRLKEEQLMFEDLSLFKPEDLPSSWRVTWLPQALDSKEMSDLIGDTRRVPAVIDVAFDEKASDYAKTLRDQWRHIKVVLSILTIALCLLVFISAAPVVFDSKRTPFDGIFFLQTVLIDLALWSLGFLAVLKLIGALPPTFLAVGLAVGVAHFAWVWKRHFIA